MRTIYVECKPDYTLVKSIANIPRRQINHAGNKSEVCKTLKKCEMCIGLVDEDPFSVQPSYFQDLHVKELSLHELKVLHDTSRDNYVVVLCPRLEDWILKAAQEISVDVKEYGLPDDDVELHKRINKNLGRFEELIRELESCKRVKTLRNLLVI